MILSEKYELIRTLARNFAKKELTREVLDQVEQTGVFPEEILQKMADAGFFGIKIPRQYGGQGGDHLAYVCVMEEISRVSAVAGVYVSSPNSLATAPLLLSGTQEQIENYVTPVAQGKMKLAFALTEPGAGSDAGGVATTAVKDGDEYVLNGRKCFITMAPFADYAIVYAKTDPQQKGARGISAFLVDLNAPGVTRGKAEHKMGLIGCGTGDIVLRNVRIPAKNLIGKEGKGFSNAMKVLDSGRLGVAAQALGVAQGCLDAAVQYAKERKQFGRKIGDFQAIGFMLAEMATKLEAARQMVYHAALLKDENHKDAPNACAMAKYYAAEVCNEIAAKALQIHGGYGYIKEYPIERMYRDCRIFTIYEGTSQIQQMIIASNLLK